MKNRIKKLESQPHLGLLTQIDTAVDQDLVLDILDLSDSGFTSTDLRILSDAISTAHDYESLSPPSSLSLLSSPLLSFSSPFNLFIELTW